MAKPEAMKLNEKAGIQFSLTFLIQILGTVILAVWGYSQLDARITQVQNEIATHKEKLRGIELELKENQDKPIPSDHVQNTTLFSHERELSELKSRLAALEARLYDNWHRIIK
tara:strand:- start:75 stop:413 length:339 start_codon:yes stop_codon:yes gene_type:complete